MAVTSGRSGSSEERNRTSISCRAGNEPVLAFADALAGIIAKHRTQISAHREVPEFTSSRILRNKQTKMCFLFYQDQENTDSRVGFPPISTDSRDSFDLLSAMSSSNFPVLKLKPSPKNVREACGTFFHFVLCVPAHAT